MKETKNTEIATVNQDASKYLQSMGLANKMSTQETEQFLQICKAYQLNPFKKEIYASKYGDTMSIIVGYETYLKRAERTGNLDGWNVRTEGKVSDGSLKAIVTIYRKDWSKEFTHEVYYVEYLQKTRDGRITKFWAEKPVTMTKKVAISQAFRMCFSDELGGMPYTADEIVTEDAVYQEIQSNTKETPELQSAISEMQNCNDMDCLKSTWSKYKKHQKNVDFINAKEAKKIELTPEQPEIIEPKKEN